MTDLIVVEQSATIDASAELVYAILQDYEEGHPAILPEQFERVDVIQGGQGGGTEIDVYMKLMGIRRKLNMLITDPDPGRILVETDTKTGTKTLFMVEPLPDAGKCQVTFRTEAVASKGIMGWIERFVLPRTLPGIYAKEFELLNAYAVNKSQVSAETQLQASPS